jgi:uncharacterized membrane protein
MPHWVYYALVGTTLNIVVNGGYKILSNKSGIFTLIGAVYAVTSIALLSYGILIKQDKWQGLATGLTPVMIVGLGMAWFLVMFCLVNAFARGSFSLVSPFWACAGAFLSVSLGVFILRETISMTALLGVGFYMLGAVLVARG